MKKSSYVAIRTALTDLGYDNKEILDELDKEIARGEDAKTKNMEVYDSFHDLLIENLSDSPATCGEIYEAIEEQLPEGVTKGKVQYALTHLWQDEIVKIAGKPNTYRKA